MGMFRKEEIMSEEEKKFLEIVDLKKGFEAATRQEVLRGMNFSVAKGEFCVLGPSAWNRRCSMLSEALTVRIPVISRSAVISWRR